MCHTDRSFIKEQNFLATGRIPIYQDPDPDFRVRDPDPNEIFTDPKHSKKLRNPYL